MASILNKQPIFTSTPLLITNQFDPKIPTSLREPGMVNYTTIYEDLSDYGSLITKVTVVSTGLIGMTVIPKVIYLGIKDATSGIASLYQSKVMTGVDPLTSSNIVPFVTFEFGGGLVMNKNNGYELVIAASSNRGTGGDGNEISVIVEGGTYDEPA